MLSKRVIKMPKSISNHLINSDGPVPRTILITMGIVFIGFMFSYFSNPNAVFNLKIGILVIVGSGILIGIGLYAK